MSANAISEPSKSPKRRVIVALILVAVIALSAYVFYDFNGKSFDISDRQALLIVTDSMDGDSTEYEIHSFPRNTFVMIEHLTEEEKMQIEIGDVLSFWQGGILIHHRVVELHLDQGYVVTHGDNTHASETVYLSSINGEVIGTNVWLGHLVAFVKDNFLIVLAVIAAFAIIGEVYRAYRSGVFSKKESE